MLTIRVYTDSYGYLSICIGTGTIKNAYRVTGCIPTEGNQFGKDETPASIAYRESPIYLDLSI